MGTTRLVALQDAPAAPQLFTGSLQQHFLLPPPSASTAIQATMKWTLLLLVLVGAALVVAAVDDESDDLLDQEEDSISSNSTEEDNIDDIEDDTVVRVARAAPSQKPRRRAKGGENRGAAEGKKGNKVCRYTKGAWSPCDPATNQRTRSLALKKGDTVVCQSSKTITKKCKKERRAEDFRFSAVFSFSDRSSTSTFFLS